MNRGLSGLGLSSLFLFLASTLLMAHPALAQCTRDAVLTDEERRDFVGAAAGREAEAWVELLSSPSCEEAVARAMADLAAQVHYRDDRVGYLLLRIATPKLLDVLDVRGIDHAAIPSLVMLPPPNLTGPGIPPVPPFVLPFPRVATTLPEHGPYFPAAEAGLTDLWREHPEADGRGVRIALVDDGLDLLHPALQRARDASGAIVPKVAALDVTTEPAIDSSWVPFGAAIQSAGGILRAADRDWRVPADDAYRFGRYRHTVTLGVELEPRTHPVPKVELSAGVLWHEPTGRVWLDTDGDGDFRDERTLTDYARQQDIAWFGSQDDAGDHRIPFGIIIDAGRQAVYVSIGGAHATIVSGTMAGNRETGGLFDGAAPGAQIIDVHSGITLIPALLRALARDDVDIVNRSGWVARDTPGELFGRRVMERALAVYQKPLVCYCALPGAIHVNDYQSAEMLRRNRQLPPPHGEALNSAAPFMDDGLMNVVMAPSTSLIAASRYVPLDLPWADGRRHVLESRLSPPAPDGYSIGANNSPTISLASGIVADVIGLARAKGVRYDAERLAHAIFTSARQVPGYPVARQGYGRIDAAAAWRQLEKMAAADDPAQATLTSFTLARDRRGEGDGDRVRVPVYGFHAEVASPGEAVRGELWLTRRGGYAGPRRYALSLRADDGTYRLLDEAVTLTRDVPARVRFAARVQAGLHVAFLRLTDVQADAVMQDVPLLARAPETPMRAAPGVDVYRRTLGPRQLERVYFRIEERVQAVRAAVDAPWTGPSHLSLRSVIPAPKAEAMPMSFASAPSAPAGPAVDATHHVGPMEHFVRQTTSARQGTWSFLWENRGRPEYETPYDPPAPDVPVNATLTVTKYAVRFRLDGQTVHVTNALAENEGRVESYDAKVVSERLSGRGSRASVNFEHRLADGVSQWRVSVAASLAGTAVADAFLLDCTSAPRGCVVVDQTVVGQIAAGQTSSAKTGPKTGADATLVADDPAAGVWRVMIRTRGRASGAFDYAIRHVSLTPSAVPIEPDDRKRASGARWSLTVPQPHGLGDAQYVAYRLAPSDRSGEQDRGQKRLRIAVTPLHADAP